jgi:hypothetical protein
MRRRLSVSVTRVVPGTVEDMAASVRERLKQALTAALKAKDRVTANVLRATLAAIDNAEAVETPDGCGPGAIELSPVGLAAAEVVRRALTEEQVIGIVRAEIAEREEAARGYDANGVSAQGERLRAEAALLTRVIAELVRAAPYPGRTSCGCCGVRGCLGARGRMWRGALRPFCGVCGLVSGR